ncbi:hypothetical protein ABEV00_01435 [Paenibacillus thiaminolyticus]|uniref:hypothetical protein n=1 Tax=Paenibacillus TaxID=44249 RepID=UPI0010597A24|nr:hypothetical protein [Paenibacillus dendritiformis]TDL57529.1 hypothetical protein E2R60_03220 [Paenibacillus dendritiformis]
MSIQGDILTQINKSITGVTEHTRAHPDDFNPNVLKPLLDNDVTINRQLEALPSKPISFNPGYQIVESEHDAPFRLGEIKGRTLVNKWGTGSKVLLNDGANLGYKKLTEVINLKGKRDREYYFLYYNGVLEKNKYYVVLADVKIIQNESNGKIKLGSPSHVGYTSADNSKIGCWQTVAHKFKFEKETETTAIILGSCYANGDYFDFELDAKCVRVYEISQSEFDSISNLTPEQVAMRYPYVDGMTNVRNPYAIITGGNLLPPFMEWPNIGGGNKIVEGQYKVKLLTQAKDDIVYYLIIGAGVTMTLRVNHTGRIGVNAWDINNNQIGGQSIVRYTDAQQVTFTTPENTHRISVHFGNVVEDSYLPVCEFKNPILIIGTEPKSFVQQQRSMLAFETELAAHPVNGSNPDTLFMGDDGLPYVLEKWGKVPLSPELFDGVNAEKFFDGFKQVTLLLKKRDTQTAYATITKSDGKLLMQDVFSSPLSKPDVFNIGQIDTAGNTTGYVWITILDTDSGWGPDYIPSADEIKAYFLGWRMYNNLLGRESEYNITDGTGHYKAFRKILDINADSGTSNIAPTTSYPEWTSYRLQYLKAKPTVEPVRNYELGATLSGGSNMIEAGSGIVIRERATPVIIGNGYVNLNDKGLPPSPLRYPTNKILAIYQNQAFDPQWNIMSNHPSGYGGAVAQISRSNFEPTAVYHVTYTILDPTLSASISGTMAANLRGTVSELMQDVGDIGRRLSVVETQKAEKDAPQWIDISLLSGWKNVYTIKAGFYKNDNGVVHLRGRISGGALTNGIVIAKLPRGYGVTTSEHIIPVWDGTGGPIKAGLVTIKNNDISIWNIPSDAKDIWLDDISFKTDQ